MLRRLICEIRPGLVFEYKLDWEFLYATDFDEACVKKKVIGV